MKKVPMRKCVACLQMKPKQELIRVVRTPDNVILLDKTGKANGRGAYICNQPQCFLIAQKKKSLERALKCQIGEDIMQHLYEELKK